MSEPELVQVPFAYPVIRSPKLSRRNTDLIILLNKIFDYNPDKNKDFEGKIIYFEDGASFFEDNNEEVILPGTSKLLLDIIPPRQ